ncbi:hypothetical protein LIER_13887 [Lithospermum erythrorhizon]|uniref:Uncharacterized protein n=1 Tax=Lithospermum erythrorhizon TaxID=34254 RepID=A0AAV3PZ99_LITER
MTIVKNQVTPRPYAGDFMGNEIIGPLGDRAAVTTEATAGTEGFKTQAYLVETWLLLRILKRNSASPRSNWNRSATSSNCHYRLSPAEPRVP